MSGDSSDSDTGHPMSSRSFKVVEKLGEIEAHLSLLQKNYSTISNSVQSIKPELVTVSEAVSVIEPKTMASAKNKLTFHGRQDENVDDLLDQLQFLKIANNYNDTQLFGNALLTLKSDALRWYKGEIAKDPKKFVKTVKVKEVETEVGDYSKLEKALKERFAADVTSTDLFVQVFDQKMKRGESVDAYCSRALAIMDKMSNIDDSVKVGLLVNGMIPTIKDQLNLRTDCTTIENVLKYARRLEKMSFVQKSGSFPVLAGEMEVNASTDTQVKNAGPQYRRGPCFICQGPHLKRECRYNYANTQGQFFRNPQNRGRGQNSNFRGHYANQNMQNATYSYQSPQQSFNRGVFHHRPRGSFRGRRGFRGSYRGSYRGRGNFQGGYDPPNFQTYTQHDTQHDYRGGYQNVPPYEPNAPYTYPQDMNAPTNDELYVQRQNIPHDIATNQHDNSKN